MAGSLGEAVLDLTADSGPMMKDIANAKPGALAALQTLGILGGKILAAGLMLAATAIVAITALIWKSGNTLDAAYDTIQQRTGAMGDRLQILKNDFDAVFTSVPATAGDAADAISIINQRLGLIGPALQESAEMLLELTRITGGDLLTNGEAFTRMMGDWTIKNEDAAGSLDAVYVASQKSGTGVDRLMQLVVQFGAPLRAFDFSFEQSLAMLGKWEKEGVNTELVMSSLKIAAGNFARKNIPLQEGLLKTIEAIKNAKDESKALAIGMEVFGSRAGPDMTAAIRENRFEFNELVPAIKSADGAIMATAESTMDWGERWTLFKNRMTAALGPAGMGLMEAVGKGLQAIEDVVNRPDVQAGLMMIVNGIVSLAQQAATALPVLIDQFFTFVDFLRNNQPILVAILAAIGAAIMAFVYTVVLPAAISIITALAPILLIMAAVALVAYLVYRAWTENWGGIRDAVMTFWATVQPYFQMLVDWLKVQVPIAIQTLADFWTNVLLPGIQQFFGFLAAEVFPRLTELVQWLAVNVPAGIQALITWWNNLKINVQQLWSEIGILQSKFKILTDYLHAQVSIRLKLIIQQLEWLLNTGKTITAFFGNAMLKAFSQLAGVVGNFATQIQRVAQKLTELAGAIPDWLIPGSPTPFEIGLWGVNDALKAMAKATLPTLGAAFNASLAFSPASLHAPMMADGGSGGGRQYIFNMQSSDLNEDQLRRALQRAEVLYG